jgi:2-haloacid dehalogenase
VAEIAALVFDVFGTLFDWRTSIAREVRSLAPGVAGDAFADAWRRLYQPSLERVRSGERPFAKLDVLHRESLDRLLPEFGLGNLDPPERDRLNQAWHRLDPWPDVVEGLARLHSRFVLAPLSNGNVSLLIDLARHAGLQFDTVLSTELFQAYKPQPETYLGACRLLDRDPDSVLMVAAHADDLRAAATNGLQTAFVARPLEWGASASFEHPVDAPFTFSVGDLGELADRLGC